MTDFFNTKNYLKTHIPLLTDDLNNREVDLLEDLLELQPGAKILDLPCGFGRHSLLFGERGYQVTGIDNSQDFINLAKEKAKGKENITFIKDDMRKIDFEGEFDAVLNLFTSFGYFSDEENFQMAGKMAKALKPGGKLIIDTLNREWTMLQSRENGLVWLLYPDNTVFLANNRYDLFSGRWFSDQVIVEKGQSSKQYQDIRLYTFTEIALYLKQFDLKVINVFGDLERNEYQVKSRNMVIVAQKQV